MPKIKSSVAFRDIYVLIRANQIHGINYSETVSRIQPFLVQHELKIFLSSSDLVCSKQGVLLVPSQLVGQRVTWLPGLRPIHDKSPFLAWNLPDMRGISRILPFLLLPCFYFKQQHHNRWYRNIYWTWYWQLSTLLVLRQSRAFVVCMVYYTNLYSVKIKIGIAPHSSHRT